MVGGERTLGIQAQLCRVWPDAAEPPARYSRPAETARPRRFGVVIEAIAYSPNSASPTKPRDKAKVEVDAWKKFLQARVFGLTLHHAGPSRPSDCKRPALRDRGTFRWGRYYARADRVAALRLRRRHRPIVAGGSPS